MLADPNVGYIDDFGTWVSDLRNFWSKWTTEQTGPHVVVAHSMGGHLVMRALAEGAIAPDAVALSAPMLGIDTMGLPLSFIHFLLFRPSSALFIPLVSVAYTIQAQ